MMTAYEKCERSRDNSSTNSKLKPKHLSGNLKGIVKKLYRRNMSLLFNKICLNEGLLPDYTHTLSCIHIYIYIYIYISVCVCVCLMELTYCQKMVCSSPVRKVLIYWQAKSAKTYNKWTHHDTPIITSFIYSYQQRIIEWNLYIYIYIYIADKGENE